MHFKTFVCTAFKLSVIFEVNFSLDYDFYNCLLHLRCFFCFTKYILYTFICILNS